jgi:hypothetical protein
MVYLQTHVNRRLGLTAGKLKTASIAAQPFPERFGLDLTVLIVLPTFPPKFELCFVGQGVEVTHVAQLVLDR